MLTTIYFDHNSKHPLIIRAYQDLIANAHLIGGKVFEGIEFKLNENGLSCSTYNTLLSLPSNLANLPITKVTIEAQDINQWPIEGLYTLKVEGTIVARGLVESINYSGKIIIKVVVEAEKFEYAFELMNKIRSGENPDSSWPVSDAITNPQPETDPNDH